MRLNALCLIGSLAALAVPLPAGAVTARSAEAISAQWGRLVTRLLRSGLNSDKVKR